MLGLTILAAVGRTVLAGIGTPRCGTWVSCTASGFSYAFPVGVDAGIVALLAMDLHLIRKGTPWPMLRLLAHGFTTATICSKARPPPTDSSSPPRRPARPTTWTA
ncbi:DUF2637 domain-containing protein [Kitasatospora sp. NPDC001159]